MRNNTFRWKSFLTKFAGLSSIIIVMDLFLVVFLGSQFWSNAAYFFGTDARTTFAVLMFLEGAILLSLGAGVGVDGRTVFYGKYGKIYQVDSKDMTKALEEKNEKQNDMGRILIVTGATILVISLLVILA